MRATLEALQAALPSAVLERRDALDCVELRVASPFIVPLTRFLRDRATPPFSVLIDLTAVDYPERTPRFDLIYQLLAVEPGVRIRLVCEVSERPAEVDSIHAVFPAANWLEREVFDLYGVRFLGHPDLRRILLDASFDGHPLRKDYDKRRRQPVRSGTTR